MNKKSDSQAQKKTTSVERLQQVQEAKLEKEALDQNEAQQSLVADSGDGSKAAVKEAVQPTPELVEPKVKTAKNKSIVIAVFALVLVVFIAWLSYFFYQKLSTRLLATNQQLASFTQEQHSQHQQITSSLLTQLDGAKNDVARLSLSVNESVRTVALLQQKLTDISGRRPSDWLLAEANYLVNLAGRKLWQEQDHQTAKALLQTADLRIGEMNDPSLISLRQSLATDIATLAALPKDKTQATALTIDGLISQVDNLKLNMVELPDAELETEQQGLSTSATDWRQNIAKTWHGFVDGFITVRRRKGNIEPLMAPKQQWYLEENLKNKLLQAQLALYRQQQDTFKQALELSSRWLLQFYDRKDSTTQFMLEQLGELKTLQIAVKYPRSFSSADMLYQELKRRDINTTSTQGR
ncbi:MAG: uroporphyrinogen-III C-methyltransferase [Gammaproteobacteria bacterium]|nr:uroporphyrinogen-III C-methyltransferase [Gammaproteobacteria bacterium]